MIPPFVCASPRFILAVAFHATLLHSLALAVDNSTETHQFDVVIYGGTSAAVTAAVEASRYDKSVVIVSPDHHLGGMTSNGLGWTDVGAKEAIGGLSREFYQRVYNHYLDPASWTTQTRRSYLKQTHLAPDKNLEMMFTFEPKVAQQIFEEMVEEANVTLLSGKLDRASGVTVAKKKIESIQTVDGVKVSGTVFIDATYEGDLLAAAGVPFMLGREANSEFGESLNGIQSGLAVKNQLPEGIDAYCVAGNAASGLLSGVNPTSGGPDGSKDLRLQAYCYRMVLTDKPANRIPVPKPNCYNESDYEILFRAIEAGQTRGFFKLDPMPNNKTDSNNRGGISTDYIGGNYDLETGHNYVEADDKTRAKMLQAHIDFQMGLVWTLQNHPRVPAVIRKAWGEWGLPADEFTDNGHWPCQIYVREARRMIGNVIITERHVNQAVGYEFTDSIGMGGYNMDSHNVQRHVGPDGTVKNEGDVQVKPARGPYPISYQAIVPRRGEVENLLVPVALSATHIAYGSIRMEPVFMVLGQSSGSAAAIICDRNVASWDVPYNMLRSRLVQSDQVLGNTYASHAPDVLLNIGSTALEGSVDSTDLDKSQCLPDALSNVSRER